MKFPRNARIFRGQMDATPFAGVFFCLLIFLLLASLVYTPGVRISLAESSADLPGVDGPRLAVAVDANGSFYFENEIIQNEALLERLRAEVKKSPQPVTVVVEEDKGVTSEKERVLLDLTRAAGIKQVLLETLPRTEAARASKSKDP